MADILEVGTVYDARSRLYFTVLGVAPGRAQYRIDSGPPASSGRPALVLASLCWHSGYSDRHWQASVELTADHAPVPVPWLAVRVDHSQRMALPGLADGELGDLERVIAWAIIGGIKHPR